jgi:hypothetical protein
MNTLMKWCIPNSYPSSLKILQTRVHLTGRKSPEVEQDTTLPRANVANHFWNRLTRQVNYGMQAQLFHCGSFSQQPAPWRIDGRQPISLSRKRGLR